MSDTLVQVSRLAMLSLLAVYKDILPRYKIRPPTDKELEVTVSMFLIKSLHLLSFALPKACSIQNQMFVQVSRLAMLSLLAVFKDILPGYKIKQTRDYETMQLRMYQVPCLFVLSTHCLSLL